MSETTLMHDIMTSCISPAVRLFRNNVGLFTLIDKRKIRTGLCVGSSDLIGWKTVQITPEMVGQKIAIFTALEVKDDPRDSGSPEQKQFIKQVRLSGGIAHIVRSPEEAKQLLEG